MAVRSTDIHSSAFPEKYHDGMQKYRSESTRQYMLLLLYQSIVDMLGLGVKKEKKIEKKPAGATTHYARLKNGLDA